MNDFYSYAEKLPSMIEDAKKIINSSENLSHEVYKEEVKKLFQFMADNPYSATTELIHLFGKICIFAGASAYEEIQKKNNEPHDELVSQLYIEKAKHQYGIDVLNEKFTEIANLNNKISELKNEIENKEKEISDNRTSYRLAKAKKDEQIKNLRTQISFLENQLQVYKEKIEEHAALDKNAKYIAKQHEIVGYPYSESAAIQDLEKYLEYWKNQALSNSFDKEIIEQYREKLKSKTQEYNWLKRKYNQLTGDPKSTIAKKERQSIKWREKYFGLKKLHEEYKKKYKIVNGYDGRTLKSLKGRYEQLIRQFNVEEKNKRIKDLSSKYYFLRKAYEELKAKLNSKKEN